MILFRPHLGCRLSGIPWSRCRKSRYGGNERFPGLKISAESRENTGNRIQILEAAEFDGGVHVANGKTHQTAGNPAVPEEDRVRIGAGTARSRRPLNNDFLCRSGSKKLRHHDRLCGASHCDLRAARHFEIAMSIAIDAGGVGRMSNVRDQRDIGLESVCDHRRAMQADFLLNSTDRDHVAMQFLTIVGEQSDCFRSRPSANPIVESSREDHVVSEQHRALCEHAGVTDIQSCGCFFFRLATDVDEELMKLADLRITGAILEMDRRGADHPHHGFVDTLDARDKVDPLPDDRSGVDAADLAAVDEALVVDVVDHQADLVGMAADRHSGYVFATAFEAGEAVSVGIVPG